MWWKSITFLSRDHRARLLEKPRVKHVPDNHAFCHVVTGLDYSDIPKTERVHGIGEALGLREFKFRGN